jgi:Tfp pilus assembly protein PilV
MKFNFLALRAKSGRNSAGFTLVETMTAAVIFLSLFVTAYVAIQLYALRVYTLAATKVTANAEARQVLTRIRNDIRTSNQAYIGTYSTASPTFVRANNGTAQVGNALQLLYVGTNSTATNIYYQTGSSNTLVLVTNGVSTTLLTYMTNYSCFDADDVYNNILSTYTGVQVIHLTMQFVQWEYPICSVTNTGGLNAYDFYRVQTRVVAVP